jgi:DNA-binding transcriptional ArsR family regulator
MVVEDKELLRDISSKLDTLISLVKLSNRDILTGLTKEIERDKVATQILELADGLITYSNLAKQVHEETGAAEITVKKKMAELKALGLLISRREGKETFYTNAGLLG